MYNEFDSLTDEVSSFRETKKEGLCRTGGQKVGSFPRGSTDTKEAGSRRFRRPLFQRTFDLTSSFRKTETLGCFPRVWVNVGAGVRSRLGRACVRASLAFGPRCSRGSAKRERDFFPISMLHYDVISRKRRLLHGSRPC